MNQPQSQIETNKALVKKFFAAWSRSRFDQVREMLDLDGQWWTLASRSSRSVRDQLARIAALSSETTTGYIEFDVGPLTAEDDRVAAVVESHAQFPEQGSYDNLYHFLFEIHQDRITRVWVYYDTALANRVLRGQGSTTPPVASHARDLPASGQT